MGPHRLIPMVKTQYIHWEKPIFWVNKKPPRETWEVILPDSIRTTSTGGKTPSGYCSETPKEGVSNACLALSAFW